MPGGVGIPGNVLGSAWVEVGVKDNLTPALTPIIGSLGKFSMKVLGVSTAIGALTAAIKGSADAFTEWDRELHNVWTLLDANRQQIEKEGSAIRALAREYDVSATKAAEAMYHIHSATFYGAKAMEILETAVRGAAAGLSDVIPTARMLTAVLNAYGMSADQVQRVNDLMFTTIRYGVTTMPELASQFGRLAGIAAPVGASLEDMTAAIATLTRQGIQTDWAITSLRQTLMQFIKPTKNLKDAIHDLGFESGSTLIKTYGFAGALKKVTEWAKENGVAMDQMFTNVRAVTAVLPLATTSAAAYAKDQERMANASGQAALAFKKQTESWSYQINKFKTLIGDLAISFGKLLMPAVKELISILGTLANAIRPVIEVFDKLGGGYFVAITATVTGLTSALWLAVKAFKAITTWAGAASAAMATSATTASAAAKSLASMSAVETSYIAGLAGAGKIGMVFAPSKTATAAGATGVRGLLERLGGGSILKGLGLGALGTAGLSLAIKTAIDFNFTLGHVTGVEGVLRALADSLGTVLGTTLTGAIIGSMLGGPGIGTAIGAGIGAAASITMYVVHVIRRATQGPEPGEEGWRTSAPASAGPGTSSTWSEIYKKSEEQGQTAADTFLEAWGDHWKKAVENVGVAGAIKMFAGEFDKLETTIGEASRMGADMKHLWIGAFNELSKGLTDSQKKALFAALGLKALGITLEDVGKKASESTPLLKPMGKTIYDIVRDFISKADEAQKDLEKHALDPEALSEDLSALGDIYDEAKSYLDQIESLKKAGLLPENWGEGSIAAGVIAPLERLRVKIKEWGIILGKEGVESINIAEERATSFFDNAKKWVDAFTNAKEGSLAWLIAQEQLNSILEDASAKAQEFTDQGKPIPENLAQLIEQLEKLGITLKETGADDLYTRFEKVKEALASSTKGSDEWIAEFSKIPSLFNEATALAQLYHDAQLPIPDDLAAIIDEMIQLDPALASSRSALDLFIDAVENMAVGVASAAGSLSASIADIMASIAQAANVGDVLKGVEALSGSYSYLRGKMDELERTMTSPEWGKLPPEAQAKIQESYSKLAEQLANAIPPGKTYAEIQREQEEAARKAAQEQKRMAQEAASAAKRAAEEAKRAAEEAARKAQEAFKHMFEIPALEALQKGNWEEAAKAVIGLAQHRQDVFKLAQSLPEVNGKALDLADVFGLLKNASSKLLSSLQDQIDIMQLADEDTEALEKMKLAIEGLLDPLTRLKYQIINALFGGARPSGDFLSKWIEEPAKGLFSGKAVPRLATGGTIKHEGFAYLDPGEVVIPADVYRGVSAGGSSDSLERAVQAAISAVGTCATGTCQLSKETQEEINKVRTDIEKVTEEYTTSCQKCAQSHAQLSEANKALEGIPSSIEAIMKQFEAAGVNVSDLASQNAVKFMYLANNIGLVEDAFSAVEQDIEKLRGTKYVEEADRLRRGFMLLHAELEGIPPELALFRDSLSKYGDQVKSLIDKLLPKLSGVSDALYAIIQTSSSLNWHYLVSAGEKLTATVKSLHHAGGALVKGFMKVAKEDIVDAGKQFSIAAQNFLKAGGLSVVNAIVDLISSILEMITQRLEERLKKLENVFDLYTKGFEKIGKLIPLGGILGATMEAFISTLKMATLDGVNLLNAFLDTFITWISAIIDTFKGLIEQSDAYQTLQKEAGIIWKSISNLLGQFLWPLVSMLRYLREWLGIQDQVNRELGASLNVPSGYKVARAEWKAAEPGIPGLPSSSEAKVPAWADAVGKKLAEMLQDILASFGIDSWSDIFDTVRTAVQNFWDWIVKKIPDIKVSLTKSLDTIATWLSDHGITLNGIVAALETGVDWIIENGPDVVKNTIKFVDWLIGEGSKMVDWIVTKLPTWDEFQGILDDISKKFEDARRSIDDLTKKLDFAGLITAIDDTKKAIDSMKNVLRWVILTAAGAIIGGIAGALSPLTLGSSLPLAGLGMLAGGALGAAIARMVPKFQEGGIVPGPIGVAQLAVVHGGEMVIPAPIASSVQAGSIPSVIDNRIYIDGREIYRSMQRIARDQDARMTGSSIGGRHWRVA